MKLIALFLVLGAVIVITGKFEGGFYDQQKEQACARN